MNAELKQFAEWAGGITAASIVFRNGIVVARFIAFLSELRKIIERIGHNSERAVQIAEEAKTAASDALELAKATAGTLQGQDDKLDQILGRLDSRPERKATKE